MNKNNRYYFAYGSNLNVDDWKQWCTRSGISPDCLQPFGTGRLPDFELVFDYWSGSRGGGVLDLKRRLGQLVPGLLFTANEEGWVALDKKEGAPNVYERFDWVALDDSGKQLPVTTFRVRKEMLAYDGYVAPTSEYLDVVRKGYEKWRLDPSMLNAVAKNLPARLEIDALFVYGTLMRGEERFHLLYKHGLKCALLAETRGTLLDLGDYPGMIAATREREEWVQGEFVRMGNIDQALEELDRIEGFAGFDKDRSLFKRSVIDIGMCDGHVRRAWTYLYADCSASAQIIESGDWRAHQGRRTAFIEQLVAEHVDGTEFQTACRLATRDMFAPREEIAAEATTLMPLADSLEKQAFSERELAQVSGKWVAIPDSRHGGRERVT